MQLDLVRIGQSNKGTFGALCAGEIPFALTLERPWQNNATNLSSIPAGRYLCSRTYSPKFGEVFQVLNVPGRSGILFHRGNSISDTQGCILVGEEFAGSLELPLLAHSARGYSDFMLRLEGVTVFDLVLYDPPPRHRLAVDRAEESGGGQEAVRR